MDDVTGVDRRVDAYTEPPGEDAGLDRPGNGRKVPVLRVDANLDRMAALWYSFCA